MSLLSYIVGWNGRATTGNNLAVSYKTKHTPFDLTVTLLGIYPKEIKLTFLQKHGQECS